MQSKPSTFRIIKILDVMQMEFLSNHVDRHQQVTVLKDELAIRYAKLQMQYEALHKEMLDYKGRNRPSSPNY